MQPLLLDTDTGLDTVAGLLTGAVSHRLQLQKIAPEYYLTLKHHTSWCYVIWSFLTDPEVCPTPVILWGPCSVWQIARLCCIKARLCIW